MAKSPAAKGASVTLQLFEFAITLLQDSSAALSMTIRDVLHKEWLLELVVAKDG